ncbi:MAG: trypsin-like peptidase domain-containing protein [Chloroflexi bacterium]|nr:trypsin-like peptidase domain-containing protein [Chloroflexota bacterium]
MTVTDFGIDRGALSQAAAELLERLRPSVVSVRAGRHGMGAGVIWRPEGVIVTNAHVAQVPPFEVVLADGRTLPARLVARDSARDLAVLQVVAADLPAAPVGTARTLRVGELVFAIGHPLGEPYSAAVGILQERVRDGRALLRADIALYPGNSGGPLVDARGQVVGVASMVVPPRLALAVPSEVVADFVARLGQRRIGLRVVRVALPPPLVARLGLRDEHGVMVVEVHPDGPAAAAGLLPGDVLLAAHGQLLTTTERLAAVVSASDGPVPLTVLRGGRLRPVVVVPRSAP